MEKFIPYEKLSKKEKRKMDLAKRQTWGDLNPVTRKPTNSKAYNRKRAQAWKKNIPDLRSLFLLYFHVSHDKIFKDHLVKFLSTCVKRCVPIRAQVIF